MRRCILVFAWAMTVMGMQATNREAGFVPEVTVNNSNKTAMWIATPTIGTDIPSVGENSNQHAATVPREGMTVTTGSAGTITGQVSGDVYTLTITQEGQVADAVADQGVRDILATMKTFKVVGGMMGSQDFAALSSVATQTIDLGGTTVSPQVASLSMANSTTKYIIMPDGSDKALVNASTFASCTALEAAFAGVYTLQSDNSKKITEITAYVKKPNSLRNAMGQESRIQIDPWKYVAGSIKKATLSGSLMPNDISKGYWANYLDANGHLSYKVNGNTLEHTGTTTSDQTALLYAQLESLDLSGAVFETQTDMNFNILINGTSLREIKLPTSPKMTLLPPCALNNFQKLTELCIPHNYQEIGQGALYLCTTTKITTTDEAGNIIDNGPRSITLPANLTYVGTAAFQLGLNENTGIPLDVYVLAKEAPVCEKDAFNAGMLYGWGGYSPVTGAITRECYPRFAILHFPSDVTLSQAKNYTDLTREYTQPDANLTTDGNGKVLMWPSQSEYNRSIEQANTGYTWGAWDETRDQYTNAIPNAYATSHITQEIGDNMWKANGSPAGMTYDATKYMGWHQFTLAQTANYEDPSPQWNISSFKYNDWYTFCVPFDMTKEDLLKFFGAEATAETGTIVITDKTKGKQITLNVGEKLYPDVRALTGVTRIEPNITLLLSKNLTRDENKFNYVSQLTPTYSNYNKGEAVIKAGYPYLIKPFLTEEQLLMAKTEGRSVAITNDMVNSKLAQDPTLKAITPKLDYHVKAFDGKGNEITGYTYSFAGTFIKGEIPAASGYYYLGHSKTLDKNTFFVQNKSTPLALNPYTCLIGAMADFQLKRNETKDGVHYTFDMTENVKDDFVSGAKANFVMLFDDSQTTGIHDMQEEGNKSAPVVMKVYSINGQYAGTNIERLPKGLYIVNGKKKVVK